MRRINVILTYVTYLFWTAVTLRLLAGLSKLNIQGGGSWPPVQNVALKSSITVNATCGQNGPEEHCDMIDVDTHRSRASQCEICDGNSTDFDKRHHIEYAIDGTNRYWQSPSLQYGNEFEYVTITVDLKQEIIISFLLNDPITQDKINACSGLSFQ
ncbi:Laminin subunit alpha-1 [Pseudolycoriella hygida]|uniref:Laminin subunit alpha-1 n=1 Tax=Pseudolycoriella hygida TaxID=35572 RepID=A0A9Q0S5Z7_9DIPT|nr:Laminin subunit alpha-1 [Pseudolycoriella hygida]